jgi:peptidoglycan/LPS O-acetylase OafA/YrhL
MVPPPPPPERPAFRPDVEGLRGVAILLVVAFHAGVVGLAGGFVGVDVFFVLSGFFITGLILRELTSTGRIDLTAFYGRRALRLLPALLVTLLVTLAAVMWLYAPIDRADVAANARAVALYAGNVEFARSSLDYFGSADNPLLHTWSLAVEEQFYLVWPLLFLVVAAIASSRTSRERIAEDPEAAEESARKAIVVGIVIAGALSLVASLWLTRVSQPWAFFGMPTRIWEFALGGALMLVMTTPTSPLGSRLAAMSASAGGALQVAGLLAIALAVLTYDRATPYPGLAALLPAFGAAALLVGGDRAPDSAVSRALGASWLRWLGRLSYAWYLWHWPLVGIGAVLDWEIGVLGRLIWSAAALVLAWLTYRCIEEPARVGRLRIPELWIAPAALSASVVAALVAHGTMLAAVRQTARPDQRAFAAARVDRMDHDCWATTVDDFKGICAFGDSHASTTVVLFGDSHAEHWLGAMDRIGRERGWKVLAMVKGGCPVPDMPELVNTRLKRLYYECTRYREAMLRRIVALRPAAVILSSWDHYMPVDGKGLPWHVTPDMWRRGLRRTYARLSAAGIRTIAIRGTPRTWFDVPACLSRRAARLPFARACVYERARALSPTAISAQNEAARGLQVAFVDMNDQICATARCPVMRNGIVVFTDDNHLTATFSRSLAPVLGVRIEAAMNNR